MKGLSKFTKNAYADYQEQVTKWEETCGTKVKRDTVCDRIIRECVLNGKCNRLLKSGKEVHGKFAPLNLKI